MEVIPFQSVYLIYKMMFSSLLEMAQALFKFAKSLFEMAQALLKFAKSLLEMAQALLNFA